MIKKLINLLIPKTKEEPKNKLYKDIKKGDKFKTPDCMTPYYELECLSDASPVQEAFAFSVPCYQCYCKILNGNNLYIVHHALDSIQVELI